MPTYEYRCPKGHDFEHFFSRISESTSTLPCPECGEVAERRISGGAGLVFKGSGFYLTDYGKNAHRGAPAAGSGAKGEGGSSGGDAGGGSGGSGGDAKPAAGEGKPAAGADAKQKAKPESKPAAKPAAKPSGSSE